MTNPYQEPPTASPTRGCLSMFAGAVVLALVCGGLLFGATKLSDVLESRDAWAERPGSRVPSPLSSEPPNKGEGTEFGLGQLRERLAARVVRSAGVVRPTTTRCDTDDVRPRFTCQVTYDGEVVTYTVTVDINSQGGGWSAWEAQPDSLVTTREGVLAAVWRSYGTHTTELRCADGMPEKARVAVNTKLPQRCYFVPTRDHPMFRDEDDFRTREVQIIIGDGSINLPVNKQ